MASTGNGTALARDAIVAALARLKGTESSPKKTDVEFIYMSNPSWPISRPTSEDLATAEKLQRPLWISVLDSSFNPPTKAHLALACSSPPQVEPVNPGVLGNNPTSNETKADMQLVQTSRELKYDAHMLLLSVTNADKRLKPGDATYEQRLEMMALVSQEMQLAEQPATNVCVAAIDEPTFVGKSTKLKDAISNRIGSLSNRGNDGLQMDLSSGQRRDDRGQEFKLCFVLGFDTVTRLFEPKYYGSIEAMRASLRLFFAPVSEGGQDSYVVCARRQSGAKEDRETGVLSNQAQRYPPQSTEMVPDSELTEEEHQFFMSIEVREYWESGKVSLMKDIGQELQSMSSTLVRNARALVEGRGAELGRLLPLSVMEYVSKENLYKACV